VDRVALVTGASSGIGRAIAVALGADGYGVALAARRTPALEQAAAEIGEHALAVRTDVSRRDEVEELVRRTVERFGRIDVVATAAGIYRGGRFDETTEEAWDAVMDVNLKGTFLVARAAITHLRASSGYLITLSSVAGTRGMSSGNGYATSKWGIRGFTHSFLEEHRREGVRATAISPGLVATPLIGRDEDPEIISVEDVVATVRWLLTLRPIVQVKDVILERTLA
jgi:3-oxoacyl-[acyl-carrier protein] reductase